MLLWISGPAVYLLKDPGGDSGSLYIRLVEL